MGNTIHCHCPLSHYTASRSGHLYITSPGGWTPHEIELAWFEQIFFPTNIDSFYSADIKATPPSNLRKNEKCHQNKVVLFYLPRYILQPLDLTYFLLGKRKYRARFADLARFDDASSVKKARFLNCYCAGAGMVFMNAKGCARVRRYSDK